MCTLDLPRFHPLLSILQGHVTLIGFQFHQVHSSFATFVIVPTQLRHIIMMHVAFFYNIAQKASLYHQYI